jgi:molybdopterin-guanine dinucleotide biosynthesis protein A
MPSSKSVHNARPTSPARPVTVALLLARGAADDFSDVGGPRYKALLNLKGRPLADYVLRSLQDSIVDKIYIAQDPGENLQQALNPNPKNVFLDIDGRRDSLAWTVTKSLERLLDDYKPEDAGRLLIMLTPCDIPRVCPSDFNELIMQARSQSARVILTMAPYKVVRHAFPHKRFQKLYHTDIKQAMVMQSIVFVSAQALRVKHPVNQEGYNLIVLDDDGHPIPFDNEIDLVRQTRHGLWLWPSFLYHLFIKRLVAHGRSAEVFRILFDLARGRTTADRIRKYVFAALRINFGVVRSQIPEFSGDIDTVQDLELA